MVYLKTFESYTDVEEYADEVFRFLSKYNLFPAQIRHPVTFGSSVPL